MALLQSYKDETQSQFLGLQAAEYRHNNDPVPANSVCLVKGPYFMTCTRSIAEASLRVFKEMVAADQDFACLSLPVLQRVFGLIDCKVVKNSLKQPQYVSCVNSHDAVVSKLLHHESHEEELQSAFAGHVDNLHRVDGGRTLSGQVDYALTASSNTHRALNAAGATPEVRSKYFTEEALDLGAIGD